MPSKLDPSLLEPLLAAAPSETTPHLLGLARAQAGRRRPVDLLNQLQRDGFVAPHFLEQRVLHRIDGYALDAAEGFEALQLSPVAPLGVCSVLAPTSQDRTLTAQRGTEVVSDPTNVLALVCAERLSAGRAQHVKLCTVHQTLRAQSLPASAGFSRHFRLLALAEAGLGAAEDAFEVQALTGHLAVFDRFFDRLERDFECHFPARRVVLRAAAHRNTLADRLEARVHAVLPHLAIAREPLESAYYDGLRAMFYVESVDGRAIPLGDSGAFDWLRQLSSNRRLRFVASGLGIQLAPVLFRRGASLSNSQA